MTLENAYDGVKPFFYWTAVGIFLTLIPLFFLQVDYLQTKKDRDFSVLTSFEKRELAEIDAELYELEKELIRAENSLDYKSVANTRREIVELWIKRSNIVKQAPRTTIYHKLGVIND